MSRKNWPAEKLWQRAIGSKTQDARWESIWELRSRPERAIYEEAVRHATSGDSRRQEAGIDVLAQLGLEEEPVQQEVLVLLFDLLDRLAGDEGLLISLLNAIGHSTVPLSDSQVKRLALFSGHDSRLVRQSLVFALKGTRQPAANGVLLAYSADSGDAELQRLATEALSESIRGSSRPVREALWARASDDRQQTRYAAMRGLIRRKDARIVPLIYEELLQAELPEDLIAIVGMTGNPAFLPALYRKWKSENERRGATRDFLQVLADCIVELEKKDPAAEEARLRRLMQQRDCVRVIRNYGGEELRTSGLLLDMSHDLLLLAPIPDFRPDGYAVYRRADCTVLSGNVEWTTKKILEGEGLFDELVATLPHLEISNWFSVLHDLRTAGTCVMAEDERPDSARFIIGPIEDLDLKEVGIRYFDATGRLEASLTSIAFDELTLLRFGDQYSTTFSKYLLPPE